MNPPADQWAMSHGLLIALLRKLGGSIEIDLSDVRPDTMGNDAGEFDGVALVPVAGQQRVRLVLVRKGA
jgi:hypothetical protein